VVGLSLRLPNRSGNPSPHHRMPASRDLRRLRFSARRPHATQPAAPD
jgi:hypothetical protein